MGRPTLKRRELEARESETRKSASDLQQHLAERKARLAQLQKDKGILALRSVKGVVGADAQYQECLAAIETAKADVDRLVAAVPVAESESHALPRR